MPTKKTDEPIALLSLTEILHPQEKWQTDGGATVLGTTASTPCPSLQNSQNYIRRCGKRFKLSEGSSPCIQITKALQWNGYVLKT